MQELGVHKQYCLEKKRLEIHLSLTLIEAEWSE